LIRGEVTGFVRCCISKEEMQMNKLMIAFAATMALASFGCKKKDGAGGSGEAMAKMTEFKDKMCACKDAACAKSVSDEMTKWSQDQAGKTKEPVKMSEADQKKATEIGTAMGECMQKASMPAAGSGDMAGSAAAGSGDMAGSAAGSAAAGSGDMAGSAAGSAAAGSGDAAGSGSAAAGSAEKKM
jgi:hypothetical protein